MIISRYEEPDFWVTYRYGDIFTVMWLIAETYASSSTVLAFRLVVVGFTAIFAGESAESLLKMHVKLFALSFILMHMYKWLKSTQIFWNKQMLGYLDIICMFRNCYLINLFYYMCLHMTDLCKHWVYLTDLPHKQSQSDILEAKASITTATANYF